MRSFSYSTATLRIRAGGPADMLPPLSREETEPWREAYNEMVASFAAHFGSASDWWFVPLSCRDHFTSPMQARFQLVAQLDKAIASGIEKKITLTCDDGVFAQTLAEFAQSRGCHVQVSFADRLAWFGRNLRRRLRNIICVAWHMRWLARYWWVGRQHGSWREISQARDVIVIAPQHLPIIPSREGIARDTYFGELPALLHLSGEKTIATGPLLADPFEHVSAARKFRDVPVVGLEYMIGPKDVATLCLHAIARWAFPPKAPSRISGPFPNLGRLVQREIDDALASRLRCAHLEHVFSRLLRRNPGSRIIHTCENNNWERAINRAAANATPPHPTLGYLHCAVLESHMKTHVRKEEEVYRPRPQRLACTGPVARKTLLALGEYSRDYVLSGCALRFPDRADLTVRQRNPKRIARLLLLLEALPTMPGFLTFVRDASRDLAGREILIRAHPAMPLEDVAKQAGIDIAGLPTFRAAPAGSLEENIDAVDAVIFKGTTAAFTAAYMGVPLIRYSDDWWTSDDPLRACDALKFTISAPQELSRAIAHFEQMEEVEFLRQSEQARHFLEGYIRQPDAESLAPFHGRHDRTITSNAKKKQAAL